MRPRRVPSPSTIRPAALLASLHDDLLLPMSGPNGVPPDQMTPRERMDEVVAILARGLLRKAAGHPPFAKPPTPT
jgi:hypothetical protein